MAEEEKEKLLKAEEAEQKRIEKLQEAEREEEQKAKKEEAKKKRLKEKELEESEKAMAVYHEQEQKRKAEKEKEEKKKEGLQKAAKEESLKKQKQEEAEKKKIRDEENKKQAEENARIAAINAKKRARLLADLFAIFVLVVIYILVASSLMVFVVPTQHMADKLVAVLDDKNNRSWIMLATLLYWTIFGYYFYGEGTFWVFGVFFAYITFLF